MISATTRLLKNRRLCLTGDIFQGKREVLYAYLDKNNNRLLLCNEAVAQKWLNCINRNFAVLSWLERAIARRRISELFTSVTVCANGKVYLPRRFANVIKIDPDQRYDVTDKGDYQEVKLLDPSAT